MEAERSIFSFATLAFITFAGMQRDLKGFVLLNKSIDNQSMSFQIIPIYSLDRNVNANNSMYYNDS